MYDIMLNQAVLSLNLEILKSMKFNPFKHVKQITLYLYMHLISDIYIEY